MRIIDVSLEISPGLMVWPGNPGVELLPSSRLSGGDTSNVSELRLGVHTGTHVDAPWHFLPHGSTAEALPLETLVGETVVADLRRVETVVQPADLEALELPDGTSRLLCRTRNSDLWDRSTRQFPEHYISFSKEAAEWMVGHGIQLIGTDFLSVEARGTPGHPTHRTLLEAGVVVVEGLDLSRAEPGSYRFVCLPLRLAGADGAPARAILIEGA